MHLHRLTLQALGPFVGRHTIDFAELGASGLFLLEGPTGAGKSTLIDAVVFALYGKVAASDASDERLRSAHAAPTTRRRRPGPRDRVGDLPRAAHARVRAAEAARRRHDDAAVERQAVAADQPRRPGRAAHHADRRGGCRAPARRGPGPLAVRADGGAPAGRLRELPAGGPGVAPRACSRGCSAPRCTSSCSSAWSGCAPRPGAPSMRPAGRPRERSHGSSGRPGSARTTRSARRSLVRRWAWPGRSSPSSRPALRAPRARQGPPPRRRKGCAPSSSAGDGRSGWWLAGTGCAPSSGSSGPRSRAAPRTPSAATGPCSWNSCGPG